MKRAIIRLFLIAIFSCVAISSCTRGELGEPPVFGKTESVLDKKVHVEPEIITTIPSVPRWCDRLNLKKQRITVGDAALYVEEEGKGTHLVLINGGPGGTHHYFHPWFSRAKKYARVIYYDQRGCGLSGASKTA